MNKFVNKHAGVHNCGDDFHNDDLDWGQFVVLDEEKHTVILSNLFMTPLQKGKRASHHLHKFAKNGGLYSISENDEQYDCELGESYHNHVSINIYNNEPITHTKERYKFLLLCFGCSLFVYSSAIALILL